MGSETVEVNTVEVHNCSTYTMSVCILLCTQVQQNNDILCHRMLSLYVYRGFCVDSIYSCFIIKYNVMRYMVMTTYSVHYKITG